MVSQREWCDLAAKLAGREAIFGAVKAGYGNISDPTKRRSITGPCRRNFTEAFTEIYRLRHG